MTDTRMTDKGFFLDCLRKLPDRDWCTATTIEMAYKLCPESLKLSFLRGLWVQFLEWRWKSADIPRWIKRNIGIDVSIADIGGPGVKGNLE